MTSSFYFLKFFNHHWILRIRMVASTGGAMVRSTMPTSSDHRCPVWRRWLILFAVSMLLLQLNRAFQHGLSRFCKELTLFKLMRINKENSKKIHQYRSSFRLCWSFYRSTLENDDWRQKESFGKREQKGSPANRSRTSDLKITVDIHLQSSALPTELSRARKVLVRDWTRQYHSIRLMSAHFSNTHLIISGQVDVPGRHFSDVTGRKELFWKTSAYLLTADTSHFWICLFCIIKLVPTRLAFVLPNCRSLSQTDANGPRLCYPNWKENPIAICLSFGWMSTVLRGDRQKTREILCEKYEFMGFRRFLSFLKYMLDERTKKESKRESREPESNQWPKDYSWHTSTVFRSTNWAIAGSDWRAENHCLTQHWSKATLAVTNAWWFFDGWDGTMKNAHWYRQTQRS